MTLLDGYVPLSGTHDEVFGRDAQVRPALEKAFASFARRTREEFAETQALAELALLNQGVTFSVFNDQRGTEKIFPFCLLPRPIDVRRSERASDGDGRRRVRRGPCRATASTPAPGWASCRGHRPR